MRMLRIGQKSEMDRCLYGSSTLFTFQLFCSDSWKLLPLSGYIFACSVLVMQINAEVGGKKISNIK